MKKLKLKPIIEIGRRIGIKEKELELYGNYKAKISLDILERLKNKPLGKYIVVSGITPTPFGEGKTVTTIGLSQGLNKLGKNCVATLRQPSMGPVFGVKGIGTGSGYSQVLPMEDINLHFTGDIHAVSASTNLLSSIIDNHLFRGNALNIDLQNITARRVIDMNDRALREFEVCIKTHKKIYCRTTGFDITASSEVMAILALACDLHDLKTRISRIIAGFDMGSKPVTAGDLKCAGAMTALLKDAIKPNLVQTTENTPCIIHTGPFANIAHGSNSVIADLIGLKSADYVVTETGFGTDCGLEKFLNIKCRNKLLKPPDAVIIVCSIRALKMHGGLFKVIPGKRLDEGLLKKENVNAVEKGAQNLIKHIENVELFGLKAIVAINRFSYDSDKEIDVVKRIAIANGAYDAVESNVRQKGGSGGIELAESALKLCDKASRLESTFKFLYTLDMPIKEKIALIAKKIYGAKDVLYSESAENKIELFTKLGYGRLPVNMAKTHLSLSNDPNIKGMPKDFILPVSDIKIAAGAGFIYPLCGSINTMPGLPSVPSAEGIDIDRNGRISGL